MTYNGTLQGYFVSGKRTSLLLLLLSVAVWSVGLFLSPRPESVSWPGYPFSLPGEVLSALVPLLCYVAVAFILVSFHLHESRIHWLAPLYLFIVSVSTAIHYDVVASASTLFFMLLMRELLSCEPGETVTGSLFAAFALLGLMSFALPQFLWLLPMLVVYLFISNIAGAKNIMSAILGLLLPFWLLLGTMYVWPDVAVVMPSWDKFVASVELSGVADITPSRLLLVAMELGIILPVTVLFVRSSVPSKPLVRRNFMFVMIMNCFLLLLSCFIADAFELFYAWRVPGIAVMASYLFSLKITRFSNVYFIFVFVFWILIAISGIWMSR